MTNKIVIFAGPSLYGANIDQGVDPSIEWAPPARRGDIAALMASPNPPKVIALADGTFHAYPAVSHVELRHALEQGVVIYGLCSMGAIRASEMVHMGMLAWGKVAAYFCTDPDLADDEVALIHGVEAPFMPMTEPLIHIREFLSLMQDTDILTPEQAKSTRLHLQQRWYGERTLRVLREYLQTLLGERLPPAIVAALSDFRPYRLKQQDLRDFVHQRPWADGSP